MSQALLKWLFPFSFFILSVFVTFPSCTHDPSGIENLDTVCFNTEILPILQTSCGMMGCHDGTAEGFYVTDYQSIMHSVVPGDPRGSPLYKVITDIHGENLMPPTLPLSRQQRTLIHIWIAQGAMNIQCDTTGNSGGNNGGTNDSLCFVQDVLPLFISKCASCHNDTAQGEEEVHALNSYQTIMEHVTPFNPNSSSVYRSVSGGEEDIMPPPPNAPLSSDQKEMMRQWIAEGALNSDCPSAACDSAGTISFAAQVNPILQTNCVGCHNSTLASGSVNLSSYTQVKSNTQVINGHPRIIGAVRKLPGFKVMPPSFSLDVCSIRKLELWINQGAGNN